MRVRSFGGGIFPLRREHRGKPLSGESAIETLPPPALLEVPLAQSAGAACQCVVCPGDALLVGDQIGKARGHIGAPVHSPVSGVVRDIFSRTVAGGAFVACVRIENDGRDARRDPSPASLESLRPEQIIERVREGGVVGMGGAGFPTHVKLCPPGGRAVQAVLLNAAECEPYLTCDRRALLEWTPKVVMGLLCLQKAVGASRAVIGIEADQPDAIRALEACLPGTGIEILRLRPKYPQGSEKHLIMAATGREVPTGCLPADIGCLVCNVGTAVAAAEAVLEGVPLTRRIVTVSGPGVIRPGNLLCRVGTPVQALLDACGGLREDVGTVLSGGPMMGQALFDFSVPVVKTMTGVIALRETKRPPVGPCIRCGRCARVCPMRLMPMLLSDQSEHGDFAAAEKDHVLSCIECGACEYVCPAVRPLLPDIRVAKQAVMAQRRRRG